MLFLIPCPIMQGNRKAPNFWNINYQDNFLLFIDKLNDTWSDFNFVNKYVREECPYYGTDCMESAISYSNSSHIGNQT